MNLTEFPLGSKVPFADTAAIYRDAGLFPVPCEDKAANRISWRNIRRRPSDEFLSQLIDKHGDDNIGILTGERSSVFIVDVDAIDLMRPMLDRCGDTPLITATPSGGVHLWYRWDGKRCGNLRPEYPVDLKGEGGFTVCPPSYRREGEYQGQPYHFFCGSLDDIGRLPTVKPGSLPDKRYSRLEKGAEKSRNVELFTAVKEAAPAYGADDLLAFAQRFTKTHFRDHPDGLLDDYEIEKTVNSVLRYKTDDRLMLKGSGPRIITGRDEILALASEPYALALWEYLRVNNEVRPGTIAISPEAIAPKLGWSAKTVRKFRDRLIEQGRVRRVSKGKRTRLPEGTWKIAPDQYELVPEALAAARTSSRSELSTDNTTRHPSPSYSCP